MAKIIEVSGGIVSIGTENGGIEEVRASDLNFNPVVGDEVDIFKTETKVIVTKKEDKKQASMPEGGININIENTNNNSNPYQANGVGLKAVNKIAYCLLAFFLGGIGIHKFYAGKIGMGIVFIIFSWTCIPAIIGFIDFIIGLCKKADANGYILV